MESSGTEETLKDNPREVDYVHKSCRRVTNRGSPKDSIFVREQAGEVEPEVFLMLKHEANLINHFIQSKASFSINPATYGIHACKKLQDYRSVEDEAILRHLQDSMKE